MAFTSSLKLPPHLGLAALAVGSLLGVVGAIWGPTSHGVDAFLLALALSWTAAIDIDRFTLPNPLTLGLLLLGLALAATRHVFGLAEALIGAVAGYGVLAGAALFYRRFRKRDGLGFGDAKLFAAAGAWLGWAALPSVLLIASFSALIWVLAEAAIRRKFDGSRALPFGPFIAAGFWLVWTFDPGLSVS